MPPRNPQVVVDLSNLAWNYRFLGGLTGAETTIGAAVKANAYGLGDKRVAAALYSAGCRNFFAATPDEASNIRPNLGDDATVFALHDACGHPQDMEQMAAAGIVPVVNHLAALEEWRRLASKIGRRIRIAVHLDTGINRLGMPPDEQEILIAEAQGLLNGLEVRLWMSHLACADEFGRDENDAQRDAFAAVLARLPKAPASLCNSSGIFHGKGFHFDLARPGIALYGGNPVPHMPNPMREVVKLISPVLQIRNVDTGMAVGYGATHRVASKGRVATLALGYADGYIRSLSGLGVVNIGGFSAPVIGRISMDLTTVDVTGIPESAAYAGAVATVIGDGISIDSVAAAAGTISYELLTGLGTRVERVYTGGGEQ